MLSALAVLLVCGAVGLKTAADELEAAAILARQSAGHRGKPPSWTSAYAATITSQERPVDTPAGTFRTLRVTPTDVDEPRHLVVSHGVNTRGLDDPRFLHFVHSLAEAGFVVDAPHIDEMTVFRPSPLSLTVVQTLVDAAHLESQQPVGLVGVSIGGGLVLRCASDVDGCGKHVSSVLSIGGHHDLARVLRYALGEPAPTVDGGRYALVPFPYGSLAFTVSNLPRLFVRADQNAAEAAVRLLMNDQPNEGRLKARSLKGESRARLEALASFPDKRPLPKAFFRVLDERVGAYRAVSPRGFTHLMRANVVVVHGADDPIIPTSELGWLKREIPSDRLLAAVEAPSLTHVDTSTRFPLSRRLALIGALATFFESVRDHPGFNDPPEPPGSRE